MATEQQEIAAPAPVTDLDDSAPVPDPPLFLGHFAAIGGPLVTVLGGAMTTLAVTAPEGLAPWIQWVAHGFWALVGVVLVILGTWWAYEGAERRAKVIAKLRLRMAADAAKVEGKVAGGKAETSLGLMECLSPLFHDLGQMSDSQSVTHGASLVLRAYGSVTKLIRVPQSRACVYYLDHLELEDEEPDGSNPPVKERNLLTLRTPHDGRFDEPRASFLRKSGPVADDVFKVIDENAPRLIPDVRRDNDGIQLDCDGKVYRTFLNVPIKFQDWEYGVLSIDAAEPGSLKHHHLVIAQLLGRMMAVGIRREQRQKKTKGSTPHASATRS